MNTNRRRLCAWAAASPLSTWLPRARAQAQPRWAGLLRERVQLEGKGLAAALIEPAGVQLAYAGTRGAGIDAPPDAGSRFEYGSITKTFTALLLADMVRRRELALDDAVEAVLGQRLRDRAGEPVRWLDLATHRSGLPRLPGNLQPRDGANPYADYDAAKLREFIETWQPQVPRQARFEYSNLGFGLLGYALAQRAGTSYAALLAERVLRPLRLEGVGLAIAGEPGGGVLQGHDPDGKPVPRWTFDALAGAGALVGPASALARYAQAALGLIDTPLAPAFALALQRHADAGRTAPGVGLGWILASVKGREVATHDGGTFGFASILFVDRSEQRATLVLANAMVPVTDLALHLLEPSIPARDIASERRSTQREAVALPPAALEPLTGTYALNPQFKVTVRMRDGRLFAQATGQGEFELFALDARRFFARVTPLQMQFEGDEGVASAFVLEQGGRRMRFVRE